jgi:hypothetical protein
MRLNPRYDGPAIIDVSALVADPSEAVIRQRNRQHLAEVRHHMDPDATRARDLGPITAASLAVLIPAGTNHAASGSESASVGYGRFPHTECLTAYDQGPCPP